MGAEQGKSCRVIASVGPGVSSLGADRLGLLDYARFLAAIAVMAFHYGLNGFTNGKIELLARSPAFANSVKYGYLGVEFFFIISGFVICRSITGKTPGEFLASRAVRIFPAFWISVLITSTFAFVLSSGRMHVGIGQLLWNLTMVPGLLNVPYVDGVYWTLQLELAFYLAIFGMMLGGSPRWLKTGLLAWPFVMLVAFWAQKWHWPYLGGYFAFFAAGAVLAQRHDGASWRLTAVPLVVCLYLCIASATRKVSNLSVAKGVVYESWVIGLLIAMMFIFFLALRRIGSSGRTYPGSRLAGALTYPLYLLHAHIGYMVISAVSLRYGAHLAYVVAIVTVFTLAYAVHLIIEVRMRGLWKRIFDTLVRTPIDAAHRRVIRL